MDEENRPPELDDKDRLEEQARAERIERDEATVFDGIFSAIDVAAERRIENLQKYGLKNPVAQTPEQEFEHTRLWDSMDDKKKKLFWDMRRAYNGRDFSLGERDALLRYVAENPIEVTRRHLWRIRRGLDEPLFGVKTEEELKKRNKVEKWHVKTTVWLCEECADTLREESEKKEGVSPSLYQNNRQQEMGNPTYLTDGEEFSYLFEWGEGYYINRRAVGDIAGLFRFPASEPHVCELCHVDDVQLWREQFGEEEDS